MLTRIPPQWRHTIYEAVKFLSVLAAGFGWFSQQQAELVGAAAAAFLISSLASANTPSNPGTKPEVPQVSGSGNLREDFPPIVTDLIQRAPNALDALAQVRAAIEKATADGEAQTRRITDELGRPLRVQITPENKR